MNLEGWIARASSEITTLASAWVTPEQRARTWDILHHSRQRLRHWRYLAATWIGLGALVLMQAGASAAMLVLFSTVILALAALLPRWRWREDAKLSARLVEQPSVLWPALLAALPDPAIMLSANGMVLAHNAGAAALFAPLRIGVRATGIIRNPEFQAVLAEADALGGQASISFATRVPHERRLLVSAGRLPADPNGGDAPAFLVSVRDLTEQDRIERMRSDFIANASHELRTPLTAVIGFIETLQGTARDDAHARARFLPIMAEQARRMQRLINDLLALTRVEMHEHIPPDTAIDFAGLMTDVAAGLEPLAKTAKMTVVVEPATGPHMVRGDRDELVQAVQNLVQNALNYGRPGGKVILSTRQDAAALALGVGARLPLEAGAVTASIALTVADDGPGIAALHLPRLTERFYRAEPVAGKSGTGLGLAIVKHIVSRHRGTLEIVSEPGQGASFTMRLPTL